MKGINRAILGEVGLKCHDFAHGGIVKHCLLSIYENGMGEVAHILSDLAHRGKFFCQWGTLVSH